MAKEARNFFLFPDGNGRIQEGILTGYTYANKSFIHLTNVRKLPVEEEALHFLKAEGAKNRKIGPFICGGPPIVRRELRI